MSLEVKCVLKPYALVRNTRTHDEFKVYPNGYVVAWNSVAYDYIEYDDYYDDYDAIKSMGLAALKHETKYFYSGPEGYFYVNTIKDGEKILSLMNVDKDDWTATELKPE